MVVNVPTPQPRPQSRPTPVVVATTPIDPIPIASEPEVQNLGREVTFFSQAAEQGLSWNVWKFVPMA